MESEDKMENNLRKKKRSGFLRRRTKRESEEEAKTLLPLINVEDEFNWSLGSTWMRLEEIEELKKRDSVILRQHDGCGYQSFKRSESPWTVGRLELYEICTPTEIPPQLSPAPDGVVYGKAVPFELPGNSFIQPSETVQLIDFLRETPSKPPKKPTLKDKVEWKRALVKALHENPNAVPEFAPLLEGVNNRIDQDKDILSEEELDRKCDPNKIVIPPVFRQHNPTPPSELPLARPARPLLLSETPAFPRFCPPVLPIQQFDPGAVRDNWGVASGGEHASCYETAEERAKRIEVAEKARTQRIANDGYLRLQGQRQINDLSIDRPPPLSEIILSQPLRLTSAGEKKLKQQKDEKEVKETAAAALLATDFTLEPHCLWRQKPLQSRPQSFKLSYLTSPDCFIDESYQKVQEQVLVKCSTPPKALNSPLTPNEQPSRKISEPIPSSQLREDRPLNKFDLLRLATFNEDAALSPRSPEPGPVPHGPLIDFPDNSGDVAPVKLTPLEIHTERPSKTVPEARDYLVRRATEPVTQTVVPSNAAKSLFCCESVSPRSASRNDEKFDGKGIPLLKSTNLNNASSIDILLPEKGERYHMWDKALLATKKPPIIAQPPPPDRLPPPRPMTNLWIPSHNLDTSPIQGNAANPFNISGENIQLRHSNRLVPGRKKTVKSKESQLEPIFVSESEQSHSNKVFDEESLFFEVQKALTENSKKTNRLYKNQENKTEDAAILAEFHFPTVPQGGQSPFDDADDERRRAWDDAQKSLTSQDRARLQDNFNLEKLAKLLPHLAPEQKESPGLTETPPRVGVETLHRPGGEPPRTRDGQVIEQAVSSCSPCYQCKDQISVNAACQDDGFGHGRAQPHSVDSNLMGFSGPSEDRTQKCPSNDHNEKHSSRAWPRRHGFGQDDEEEDEEDDDVDDEVPPQLPARSPLKRQQSGAHQEAVETSPPAVQPPKRCRTRTNAPTRVSATVTAIASATPAPATAIATVYPTRDAAAPRNIGEAYRPTRIFSPLGHHSPPPLPTRALPPLPPLRPDRPAQASLEPASVPAPKKPLVVSFLGGSLPVSEYHPAKMESKLQVRPSEFSSVKTKAVEDARQMQATVIEAASKAGKDPPKYALLELIGKGSFGRVYKGKDMTSAAIVAVKIIDIDESDTLNPRLADSYSEFLKEVNALKILSESNARNINHVIEALPVGQSMWMITEHCGGGSIATLMKPTAPGGLQEKWIIPVLREVAEAIKWVHQAGIIHRDIKCANVLITEQGGVQLCDFGVAGIIENKLDKRSTVIGTPHWMAPELFDATPSYGKEVDIWAFGSMVFEIATGLPPNVANGISFERLGTHLKQHVPRLEGGNYSNDLRNLVAYCLEELPSARPTVEQVQRHPYIYNTSSKYPAASLSALVRAFKMWEDHGGSRKSLFMLGGAQGPSELLSSGSDDEWNFSTTAAFDHDVLRKSTPADVFDAYGNGVALDGFFTEETSRPQKPSRRRPPPEALHRLPAPLEKIFDPNTMSSYEDNSRNHYGRVMQQPASDLPLRDDTAHTSIKDTMIDLGGHDSDTGLSNFPDMDTIKANRRGGREEAEDEYTSTLHDFSRPALSDPADINPNRRTQDWKFPSMAPPASADPELSRFPNSYDLPRPMVTPGSGGPGGRPTLVHHPTEPIGAAFAGSLLTQQPAIDRLSMRESLIDLDMSMPDTIPSFIPNFAPSTTRPSTANSDTGSATSEHMTSGNPFDLERHASLYEPISSESTGITDPEYYLSEESAVPARLRSNSTIRDINEISDFSASDAESSHDPSVDGKYDTYSDSDIPPPPVPAQAPFPRPLNQPYTFNHFPELPAPPSEKALSGLATHDEMKGEFNRMLSSMTSQLEAFRDVYSAPQVVSRKGPTPQRRERKAGGGGGAFTGASNSG